MEIGKKEAKQKARPKNWCEAIVTPGQFQTESASHSFTSTECQLCAKLRRQTQMPGPGFNELLSKVRDK